MKRVRKTAKVYYQALEKNVFGPVFAVTIFQTIETGFVIILMKVY